jgi:hypothetical protein
MRLYDSSFGSQILSMKRRAHDARGTVAVAEHERAAILQTGRRVCRRRPPPCGGKRRAANTKAELRLDDRAADAIGVPKPPQGSKAGVLLYRLAAC